MMLASRKFVKTISKLKRIAFFQTSLKELGFENEDSRGSYNKFFSSEVLNTLGIKFKPAEIAFVKTSQGQKRGFKVSEKAHPKLIYLIKGELNCKIFKESVKFNQELLKLEDFKNPEIIESCEVFETNLKTGDLLYLPKGSNWGNLAVEETEFVYATGK